MHGPAGRRLRHVHREEGLAPLLLALLAFASAGEPLPLPTWDTPPPGGAWRTGIVLNRTALWMAGSGVLHAAAGTGMLLAGGGYGYGFTYPAGVTLVLSGAAAFTLATPLAAFGPLVSCRGLVASGMRVSCIAGSVAVGALFVSTGAIVVAVAEPDLDGTPAWIALAGVPVVWGANLIQVQGNRRGLELAVVPTPRGVALGGSF